LQKNFEEKLRKQPSQKNVLFYITNNRKSKGEKSDKQSDGLWTGFEYNSEETVQMDSN
jgi:hypothetical protein